MSAGDTSDDDICFGSFGLDDNEGDINGTTDIGVAGSNPASAQEDSSSSTTCANGADQAPPPPESATPSNGPAPPPAAKKYSTWASLLSKPASEQGGAAPSGSGTEAAGADTNGVNGHGAASGVGQGQKQMASAEDGKGKEAEASVRLDHLYKILSGLAEGTVTQALLERRARGLANTGNTCFRNVILQALLSCEPFYRVLWELKPALDDAALRPTCEAAVPTWMQLARLASSFEDPGLAKMVTYRKKEVDDDDEVVVTGKKGKGRKTSSGSLSSSTSRPAREEWIGSVRPDDYLGEAFSEFRRCSPGQQEDAQEFLTFFLVKLHEEVLAVQKAGGFVRRGAGGGAGATEGAAANGGAAGGHQDENGHAESEGDGWQEIGKGGTKAVLNSTTTAEAEDRYDSSAITRVFHGRLRSDLRRAGSRTVSATFQRFECLQLDIKSREVGSVEDALNLYLSEETLTEGGFKGAKRMSLEVLPPVLILHLKRFTFDPARGPLKVVKPVDYAPSLTIPANLLSSSLKATLPKGARYNLYCVVLHFGRTVGGGHYTSYCRGHYPGEWYYFDDERVERVSEMQAISHKEQCYLCFYEREEA